MSAAAALCLDVAYDEVQLELRDFSRWFILLQQLLLMR